MLTVLSVIGTRPEAIKMAPVVRELRSHTASLRSVVCATGQHRDMLDPVFRLFGVEPDHDLAVMESDQALARLTAHLLERLDKLVASVRPDWILAQGDTTTVLAASLVALYRRASFGHVEAGLRTGDFGHPFPEEANRCVADRLATLMFAPTERAREALLAEGADETRIILTGNTVIDALRWAAEIPYAWASGPLAAIPADARLVLVTAHRRESFGEPLRQIGHAVRRLAERFAPDAVHFVYPVHPNPNVRKPALALLTGVPNVHLVSPLDYLSMVHLMKRSTLILTDSGGLQEEAPGLRVPVLVLRHTTERPEAVEAGVAKLVGTVADRIVEEATRLLTDSQAHAAMARGAHPYGDGKAAQRIVDALLARPRVSLSGPGAGP